MPSALLSLSFLVSRLDRDSLFKIKRGRKKKREEGKKGRKRFLLPE